LSCERQVIGAAPVPSAPPCRLTAARLAPEYGMEHVMAWPTPDSSVSAAQRLREALVAESRAMREVSEAIDDLSTTDAPVLIEGEPGTGKEFVARLIHLQSPRGRHGFGVLLPPALPAGLATDAIMEAQPRILRHASGGTLLLKEAWQLPAAAQHQIAQTLAQDLGADRTPIEVHDVRLMMSSRIPFEQASQRGLLLPPLQGLPAGSWMRLRRLHVPPLRRRPADIPLLAMALAREHASQMGRTAPTFSEKAMDRLIAHPWPGNLAELKRVVFHLVSHATTGHVEESHLAGLISAVEDEVPLARFGLEDLVRAKLRTFLGRIRGYHVEDLHAQVLGQVERPLLELVLEQTGGNQLQAAQILGINRNTLRKKIRALGVRLPS